MKINYKILGIFLNKQDCAGDLKQKGEKSENEEYFIN
jgi:hypothetical protein